ncbi:MAG: SspB family protein [Reyranellaceae bacterium]
MADKLQYDALVDDALRSVVRRVLTMIASDGLPGAHHFYISFRTTAPGVQMPEYLREKYPDDMTIVLQHQYWDLTVGEESFEVTVSFNKRNERLKVPFAAMVAFVDPSVRFGLQFEKRDQPASQLPAPETLPALAGPPDADAASPDGSAAASDKDSLHVTAEDMKDDKPAKDSDTKVVALDAFRKK